MLNSSISDTQNGARFMSTDLCDFFLNTPMQYAEYMKIHYKYFPKAIRTTYKLDSLVTPQGCVYIKIKKGIHDLKQAARIAYDLLKTRLTNNGYTSCMGDINF